jgi:hypothetical protein
MSLIRDIDKERVHRSLDLSKKGPFDLRYFEEGLLPGQREIADLRLDIGSVIEGIVSSTGRRPVEDFPFRLPCLPGSMQGIERNR